MEFLGRIDNQVKLRGYRIELGEIEAVLGEHPEVRQVVVVVREDQPGDKRLVAYFVPASGAELDADKLRGYVREKLPNYMIPSAFVFLESFPLTVSGKVDRKALPMPQMGGLEKQEYIEPRNQTELVLSKIWMDVLGIRRVSRGDNFFDIGGNSLSAIRVMARIQDEFEIAMPVRRIFEFSCLSELAVQVDLARIYQKQNSGSQEQKDDCEEHSL